MITIINLTPHEIVILKKSYILSDGMRVARWLPAITFPPSADVINCIGQTEQEAFIDAGYDYKIPLTYTTYTPPKSVPPIKPDTIYIVSELVARLYPDRPDFRIVNGVIRNDYGKVIGCRSLGRIKPLIDMPTLNLTYSAFVDVFHMIDDEEIHLSEAMHKALCKFELLLDQLETTKG
jgi:hypothetical protein